MKNLMTHWVLSILLALPATHSAAGQDFWTKTNGPFYGHTTSLTMDASGRIFVSYYGGTIRSTDGGRTWDQVLDSVNIYALTVNASGHIFAGGESLGSQGRRILFRSTDHGGSWTTLLEGVGVTAIAVNPEGTIFLGYVDEQGLYGLLRSADNGQSWTGLMDSMDISAIAVDGNDTLYAGGVDYRRNTWRLLRSTNSGQDWGGVLDSVAVEDVAVNSKGVVFAGGYDFHRNAGRLLRSTDNGLTWTPLLDSIDVRTIAVNSNDDIFVGVYNHRTISPAIFRSTDDGQTWSHFGPHGVSAGQIVVARDGRIFAGTQGCGVFASDDNGNSWTQIHPGLTPAPVGDLATLSDGSILSATGGVACYYTCNAYGGGLFRSTDGGDSWNLLTTVFNNAAVQALAVNTAGHIFAGAWSLGVLRSTDNGRSWVRVDSGFSNTDVHTLGINLNGDIFAGIHEGDGIYRSTDNGTSWVVANEGLTNTNLSAFAFSGTNIFAATGGRWGIGGGVFRSHDNGATWTPANSGLADTSVGALISTGNVLLAGTSNGVFRSSDDGTHYDGTQWTAAGLSGQHVVDLMTNSTGDIFAATVGRWGVGGGVFRSSDNGFTWEDVSNGLSGNGVWSLAVDSSGYLLAGTLRDGVFRSALSTTSVEAGSGRVPEAFVLEQNYPNPFNPSTTFRFSIPFRSAVTLKVIDVLGREVVTLVSEEMDAGTYSATWNAEGMASGVYLYRMAAGANVQTRRMLLLK